jgi:hypothetical protein
MDKARAPLGQPSIRRDLQVAMEVGDLTFAAYSIKNLMTNLLVTEIPRHREMHPLLWQEALNQHHTEAVKLSFGLFDEIEKASDALWNLLLGLCFLVRERAFHDACP